MPSEKRPQKFCENRFFIFFFRILVPFSGLFPGYAYYYLPLLASLLCFFLALDSVVWCGIGPPDDVSSFLLGSSIIQHTVALCAALLLYGFSTLAWNYKENRRSGRQPFHFHSLSLLYSLLKRRAFNVPEFGLKKGLKPHRLWVTHKKGSEW